MKRERTADDPSEDGMEWPDGDLMIKRALDDALARQRDAMIPRIVIPPEAAEVRAANAIADAIREVFSERDGKVAPKKKRGKRGPPDDVLLVEVKAFLAKWPGISPSEACRRVGRTHNLTGKRVADRLKEFTSNNTLPDAVA